MRAQRAVDAAAFYAEYDAKIDGYPFGFDARTTVGTPAISLVMISDNLKQFGGILFKRIAVRTYVGGAGTDGRAAVNVVGPRRR